MKFIFSAIIILLLGFSSSLENFSQVEKDEVEVSIDDQKQKGDFCNFSFDEVNYSEVGISPDDSRNLDKEGYLSNLFLIGHDYDYNQVETFVNYNCNRGLRAEQKNLSLLTGSFKFKHYWSIQKYRSRLRTPKAYEEVGISPNDIQL